MKEKTLCKFTCNRVFSFQAYAYGESRTHEQGAKRIANDIWKENGESRLSELKRRGNELESGRELRMTYEETSWSPVLRMFTNYDKISSLSARSRKAVYI